MLKRLSKLLLVQAALFSSLVGAAANSRLAIGAFGLEPGSRDAELADLIGASLSTSRGFELVERRELNAALNEASLSLSGVVRANDAVRVSTLLRADQFLLGSSMRLDGTNILVVRLVDARKGTMQDVSVFRDPGSMETLAVDVAKFVRENAERPAQQHRDYLAIGVVQNLGVNNRFSDFPAQMRGYVAAKLTGKVTVLERDVMSFLADEVRLDMMGLTGQDAEHLPQMQFGFWIVDGFYQSYEVAEPVVQLKLRVERVLGGQQSFALQGKPGEAFLKTICDSIVKTLDHPPAAGEMLSSTRKGEIEALQARASQLIDYYGPDMLSRPSVVRLRAAYNPDKTRNTLDEATRVFESILLLDPENNSAKMCLAACLLFDDKGWGGFERPDKEGRVERAKEYYREVIASSDKTYAEDARIALAYACGGLDGVEMLHRFAEEADNKKARQDFEGYETGTLFMNLCYSSPRESLMPFFRKVLFERLKETEEDSNAIVKVDYKPVLFPYRSHPEAREQIINKLLPDLIHQFPRLEPYILLAAAGQQVTTNSPVTAQFLASLKNCEEHPDDIFRPKSYFCDLSSTLEEENEVKMHGGNTLLHQTFDNHQYETVVQMVLGRQKAAEKSMAPPVTDEGKRLLAESYLALKQWKEALNIFDQLPDVPAQLRNECRSHLAIAPESEELPESAWKDKADVEKIELAYTCMAHKQRETAIAILDSIGRRTVRMNSTGPWGYAFTPVLPELVAAEFRVKAGKPPVADPMRFEIGDTPYVHFIRDGNPRYFSFEAENDDLWVATYSEIKLFRGAGPFAATNPLERHAFQRTTQTATTCICVSPRYVWAGTCDDGLFELDRRTGAVRRLTMNDGMLLNGISCLFLQGDDLWIGYRNGDNGAVGKMNIATHKFSSLTAKLSPAAGTNSQPYYYQNKLDDPNQPPQSPVSCMTEVGPGEMWFGVTKKGVQRYRSADESWATLATVLFPATELTVGGIAADNRSGQVLLAATGPKMRFGEQSGMGGLVIYDYRNNDRKQMLVDEGLPSNDLTAVACGERLAWVGGRGFVAVVDTQQCKVLRIAYVSASRILKLQLGKQYAWIQVSCGGQDAFPEEAGDAWTGVYRVKRAAVEPPF